LGCFAEKEYLSMTKNLKLKTAIIKRDLTQREIARKVNIHESVLSHAISGRWNFTRVEQEKIAEALGVDSREIFQENAGA
jgi:ribosome-binding protein aMBF1 (putative translation factor)